MEFRYTVRSRSGEAKQGRLEADSREAAARRLRDRGLFVCTLRPVRGEVPLQKQLQSFRRQAAVFTRRGDLAWTALFAEQMAVLLSGGMSVHEALRIVGAAGEKAKQACVRRLCASVEGGASLAEAMRAFPQLFPRECVALVRAGESSGSLDTIFSRLARQLSARHKSREALKSVMLYPVVLLVCCALMLLFLCFFVLPSFESLLLSLHTELPLPTRLLLWCSRTLGAHGLSFFCLLVGLLSAGALLLQKEAVRLQADRFLLALPVFGPFQRYAAWAELNGAFGMLLESGIRLDRALGQLADIPDNHWIQKKLREAEALAAGGLDWQPPLLAVTPQVVLALMRAGEKVGALPEMLREAAELCFVTARNQAKRIEALAQPAAILVVGSLVLLIVLSVALPMLDAMTAISWE
ncbi:MAG: type II secretion system F family protein [Selenomonadaceae bacterium]|nr:type II secretion system F family protein [Selenomonadaceae bacterium]